MSVLVHVGPSLPPAARRDLTGVVWRPPARAGDAIRARGLKPRVFVLIDGVFDAECAIRHKELLELLAEGVPVIGAASMGALRAAELHPFGVEGVGGVFRAFRDGRLVGDDEVALLHAPAELGWAALTVPLVTVRALLCGARRQRLITRDTARRALRLAMDIAYRERTWERLAQDAYFTPELLDLGRSGAIDPKAQDALAAVLFARAVARPEPLRAPPPRTPYSLELERRIAHSSGSGLS